MVCTKWILSGVLLRYLGRREAQHPLQGVNHFSLTNTPRFYSDMINLSDALPVQFWQGSEKPFNDALHYGITPICFNQPFQCDDVIRLQFTDDDPDNDYSLLVLDKDDNVLQTVPFDKTVPGQQLIEIPVDSLQFSNPDFLSGIATWDTIAGVPGWFVTGQNFQWPGFGDQVIAESPTSGVSNTGAIGQARPDHPDRGWPAGTYSVRIRGQNLSSNGMDPKYLRLYMFSGNSDSNVNGAVTIGAFEWNIGWGNIYYDVYFTLTEPVHHLWFMWEKHGPSSGFDLKFSLDSITIQSHPSTEWIPDPTYDAKGMYELAFTFESLGICEKTVKLKVIKDGSPSEEIATSDLLSVQSHINATLAIDYSNHKDFYGIAYSETSPAPVFRLRIPAIFYEEDNPAEQEDHELANGTITRLFNKMEERRKLDIGYMPQFMHRKLQIVLMHDTVIIDGKEWIRREAYERAEGNKRYPLKRASVWLHDKNFIKKNSL